MEKRDRQSRTRAVPEEGSRQDRLGDLLAEYMDRLNAGWALDESEIARAHPELAAELIGDLRTLQQIRPRSEKDGGLETLGDYKLIRQLGRGGMGIVYEAWQNSLDRQVALKVLPAGVAADHKAFLRFMREAKTAAQLNHQNVVTVYGMGVEANTPYFAMELIEGETLAKILAKLKGAADNVETPFGATRENQAFYFKLAEAFAAVAEGLQHAHSKGIIHRDLKPSNLILAKSSDELEGRLRILDFGLARLEGQESLTLSGDFLGTPLYMSPEQARRKKIPVDHRTDIYSLGATLYEMLALRPPFQGKDHQDTLTQIIEREPAEPRKLNPRVPRDLETIALKCLRKDPADRYGTAEALAQDLRRFVRGDPIEARPQGRWAKAAARLRRHRLKLALAAAFLAVGLALGWTAYRWLTTERAYQAAAYAPAVLEAVERLSVGRFSLEAIAGRSGDLIPSPEGLIPFPGGLLTPIHPDDFRTLLGDEGERSVREAARRLGDLAAAVPQGRDAHYHLAQALKLLGEAGEARRALKRALEVDPSFAPALALEAELGGRPLPPEAMASAAGENPSPDDWRGPWLRAKRVPERSHGRAARLEAYDRLAAFTRRSGDPYAGFSLEVFLGRGAARLQAGDFEGAKLDLAVAGQLAPGALEPRLLLAKTYFLAREPEEARRTLEALYAGRGGEGGAALWIAAVCISSREHREALAWIEKLGEGALKDRLRAVALAQLGRWSAAREAAERAAGLAPEDSRASALLVWSLIGELGSREGGGRDGAEREGVEIVKRLLEGSRRIVELAPDQGHARFLRNAALATARRHIRELKRRCIMNGRKTAFQEIVSPALLAMALTAGPLGAREVCDDFAADPDWQDGDPVAWQSETCCPMQIEPGACEGLEGLAMQSAFLTTVEAFSGDVRVQMRISFCGIPHWWAAVLHGDLFQDTGYFGGVRYAGRWLFRFGKWVSGGLVWVNEKPAPADSDFTNGIYVLEFQSIGDRLELRVWQPEKGERRPDIPDHFVVDSQLRSGNAGIFYSHFEPGGRGVVSSICIAEIENPPPPLRFRRGDCNSDGEVVSQVSDAIFLLEYNFIGGAAPPCLAACDANGDGEVLGQVTDAIYLLQFNFLGGPPPAAPFPECGPGSLETDTSLGCENPTKGCE